MRTTDSIDNVRWTDIWDRDKEIERLRQQVAELEKDAERYRWLCDYQIENQHSPFMGENKVWTSKKGLDAAIDAAMGADDVQP